MLFWFAFALGFSFQAVATETDAFSVREDYVDSTPDLNLLMNQVLQQISRSQISCLGSPRQARNLLYDRVMATLAGWGTSRVEEFVIQSPHAKKVSYEQSIYRGLSLCKIGLLDLVAKIFPLKVLQPCCTPNVSLAGHVVSSDKLGHFIHTGYELYYVAELRSENIRSSSDFVSRLIDDTLEGYEVVGDGEAAALELSDLMEKGKYGVTNTGVYSFADSAANYEGYRFWRNISQGETPYFRCVAGVWTLARSFDWTPYVSAAWDEAINCNEFSDQDESDKSQSFKSTVLKNIQQVRGGLSCPLDPSACRVLSARYRGQARKVLHPDCAKYSQ